MTAADIIATATAAGVHLYVVDGALRYRAAAGAYSAQLRALVGGHRAAVVEAIAETASIEAVSPPRLSAIADTLLSGTPETAAPWLHLNALGATLPGGYFQLGPVAGDLMRLAREAQRGRTQHAREDAAREYWATWRTVPAPIFELVTPHDQAPTYD